METFKNNNKDVDHMETLEMEALRLSSAANSTEEEEDQPVDFSQNSVGNVMRTSILSKLKKKNLKNVLKKLRKCFEILFQKHF
jgi:hypothetical protein